VCPWRVAHGDTWSVDDMLIMSYGVVYGYDGLPCDHAFKVYSEIVFTTQLGTNLD